MSIEEELAEVRRQSAIIQEDRKARRRRRREVAPADAMENPVLLSLGEAIAEMSEEVRALRHELTPPPRKPSLWSRLKTGMTKERKFF